MSFGEVKQSSQGSTVLGQLTSRQCTEANIDTTWAIVEPGGLSGCLSLENVPSVGKSFPRLKRNNLPCSSPDTVRQTTCVICLLSWLPRISVIRSG